ncbi:MAG: FAD-binding oxidoreductase [Thermacetogeniaceae bacterium]
MEKQEALRRIKELCGERATDSLFERSLYSRDLAPVPALLVDPLFQTIPDLVVRPKGAEEIAEILRIAAEARIPVTPRAGASTVYFDSIPVRGGIVIDLNLLRGVEELDEGGMTVTVKAGTTWWELERYLNSRGYAPKSVPSSAPASSIAGWLCMMGYGIGSLKYGHFLSQVKWAEVVLPSGEIRRVSADTDPPLEWFAASEGTLGIITKLVIEIRRRTPMKHFLLHSPKTPGIIEVLDALRKAEIMPYNLHFTDDACLRAMFRQGIAPGNLDSGYLLAVDYEGEDAELARAEEFIASLVAEGKGISLLPDEEAEREWEDRYRSLKLKRSGPSELGGEVFLPVSNLERYLADIRKLAEKHGVEMCSYGHVATPERIIVMTMFFADETKTFEYILDLSLVKKIQDVGYRHGGCPYGVGLWNTPYLGRIYKPSELEELRGRKRRLDPKGIMNPGKVYWWPTLLNPFNFSIGMNVLAGIRRLLRGGGR